MAYSPVIWQIKYKNLSSIKGVILAGYEAQSIIGLPANIPIEIRTYKTSPACLNCTNVNDSFYAYKKSSVIFNKTISHIEDITGLKATTFQGGYKKGAFSISNNTKRLNTLKEPDRTVYKEFDDGKLSDNYRLSGKEISLPEGEWSGLFQFTMLKLNYKSEFLIFYKAINNQLIELFAIKLKVSSQFTGFEKKNLAKLILDIKAKWYQTIIWGICLKVYELERII